MPRPAHLIAGLVGLCFAYFVLACMAWNMGLPSRSLRLPQFLPEEPEVLFAEANALLRTGRLTLRRVTALKHAARLDPLEDEPLVYAAFARLAAGDDRQALLLLEHARRRNPRSREARLALLGLYSRRNEAAAAVREMAAISRLVPAANEALVPLLADLARGDPSPGTLRALRTNPLRPAILQKLADDGASVRLLLALTADLAGAAKRTDNAVWNDRLVEAVAERGDIAGAEKLWSHLYAIDHRVKKGVPFDPGFAGIAGPPFGWRVSSGSAGQAQLARGSLEITYFGRSAAEFARQLIVLAPGEYRLRFKINRMGLRPPDLAWRVACLDGGQPRLDLPARDESGSAHDFVIPTQGCRAQWLLLLGRPSLEPETRSAQIDEVTIDVGRRS